MVVRPRFVALDVEATGTSPSSDRIIELYVVELTPALKAKAELHYFFDPGLPISPRIAELTGIKPSDLAKAKPFSSAAARLQKLLSDAVLIAYNGRSFDWRILHHELQRAGQPGFKPDQRVIDPYELFLEDVPRSLAGAYKFYLGEEFSSPHRAKEDTSATLAVLKAQLARRKRTLNDPGLGVEKRRRLDVEGYFYEGPRGVTMIGFGKYRGEPAIGNPEFLEWVGKSNLPADTKQVAARILRELLT